MPQKNVFSIVDFHHGFSNIKSHDLFGLWTVWVASDFRCLIAHHLCGHCDVELIFIPLQNIFDDNVSSFLIVFIAHLTCYKMQYAIWVVCCLETRKHVKACRCLPETLCSGTSLERPPLWVVLIARCEGWNKHDMSRSYQQHDNWCVFSETFQVWTIWLEISRHF